MVFHASVHQPFPDNIVPGMNMGRWGGMVNRKQTWWPMAGEYMTYLARCQFMLRDGNFVGDVLFVTDEHLPKPQLKLHPELNKEGYDYDIISPGYFMEHARFENGKVVLPSGISYELVVFPQTKWVTAKLMKSINKAVRDGIQSIGYDYQKSPGLTNYPERDKMVCAISQKLIEDANAGKLPNYHLGMEPIAVLEKLGIKKDFAVITIPADAEINSIHHCVSGSDVYFIANQTPKYIRGTYRFRVEKGVPSLWDPVTGEIENIFIYTQKDGITEIPIELARWQSMFVVFDQTKNSASYFTRLASDQPVQKADKPTLEIQKVIRGHIFDPSVHRNVNVTSQLIPRIKDNKLMVDDVPGKEGMVDSFMGSHVSTKGGIVMHYKMNGEQVHIFEYDNVKIELDAGDAEAIPLNAHIKTQEDNYVLVTSEPGNYVLESANGETIKKVVSSYNNKLIVDTNWKVVFQKNKGVDKAYIILDSLTNLSEYSDFNIKHYSGILTYETTIDVKEDFIKNNAGIKLELEKIANIASIELNGIDCGTLWARPYSVDVSKAIKQGSNKLVIRVANSWSNRLIGDEYFPVEVKRNGEGVIDEPIPDWVRNGRIDERPVKDRITFTTNKFYTKDDPLPPSGLIGEVRLKKWISVKIK